MHSQRHGDDAPRTEGETIHWARGYDWLLRAATLGFERRFRERILDAADTRPGDRLLDVGCGTGTLALLARRRVGPQGRVTGIDPSPEMIARARDKAAAGGGAAHFELAAIEKLPFPDASFDVVTSSLMFHHLNRPLQLAGLDEIRRVLAPGGRLCIVDFDGGGPLFHRIAAHLAAHHHDDESRGLDLDAVAEAARERGFEAISLERFRPRFLRCLRARRRHEP